MESMDQGLLRETIRRTLAHRAGASPDAIAVAGSAFVTWQQVTARLEPVIGVVGVEVLFDRALDLTTPAYPWLAAADEPRSARVATFRARLETRETHTAVSAGCTVLQTFVELLATLLGVGLVTDLLAPVWEPHA